MLEEPVLEQIKAKSWRARWDLNPGFPAPQADALSVLDYEPRFFVPIKEAE